MRKFDESTWKTVDLDLWEKYNNDDLGINETGEEIAGMAEQPETRKAEEPKTDFCHECNSEYLAEYGECPNCKESDEAEYNLITAVYCNSCHSIYMSSTMCNIEECPTCASEKAEQPEVRVKEPETDFFQEAIKAGNICPDCNGRGEISTRKTKEGYPIQHIKCQGCNGTGEIKEKAEEPEVRELKENKLFSICMVPEKETLLKILFSHHPDFKEFLQKHWALDDFCNEFDRKKNDGFELFIAEKSFLISGGFDWCKAKKGFKYWEHIDKKWHVHLSTKKKTLPESFRVVMPTDYKEYEHGIVLKALAGLGFKWNGEIVPDTAQYLIDNKIETCCELCESCKFRHYKDCQFEAKLTMAEFLEEY